MRHIHKIQSVLACLALISCAHSVAQCPPKGYAQQDLETLKSQQWKIDDAQQRQKLAINLLACLAAANPTLRDEIAFEALSFWMRGKQLDLATINTIRLQLIEALEKTRPTENEDFLLPFAALTLAEISRVDRITPFLSDIERNAMVESAAKFLSGVNDYRGFDEKTGWRHGVAHAADWMLQLSLNKALTPAQHHIMLAALAMQISQSKHFYIYGEAERLMAPVLYLGLNTNLNQADWDTWFATLLKSHLNLAKTSQETLARRHNLKAFLTSLYLQVQESQQHELRNKFALNILKTLKALN